MHEPFQAGPFFHLFREPRPHRRKVLLQTGGEASASREHNTSRLLRAIRLGFRLRGSGSSRANGLGQAAARRRALRLRRRACFRHSFCSSESHSSRRMNKAATFLEVGESPATEPRLRPEAPRTAAFPSGLGAPQLRDEVGTGFLAVLVAPLADLAVELLAVVGSPRSIGGDQVGDVRGPRTLALFLYDRARGRLGEVLVAVDGPRALAQLRGRRA